MVQHHDWSTVVPGRTQQNGNLTGVNRYVLAHNHECAPRRWDRQLAGRALRAWASR